MQSKTFSLIAIWTNLFLILVSYAHAASVRQISLDEMIQQCQLVFEGKVLSLETKDSNIKHIYTYVTFKVQDIIKGKYPDSIITLSFLGGTAGGITLAISDMKVPQVGEHGIYFVESLENSQVNPLYGWSQGHFLVQPDNNGTNRVMTSNEEPVTGIMKDVSVLQSLHLLSKGVAKGIIFSLKGNENEGLTPADFKNLLREKLEMTQ